MSGTYSKHVGNKCASDTRDTRICTVSLVNSRVTSYNVTINVDAAKIGDTHVISTLTPEKMFIMRL